MDSATTQQAGNCLTQIIFHNQCAWGVVTKLDPEAGIRKSNGARNPFPMRKRPLLLHSTSSGRLVRAGQMIISDSWVGHSRCVICVCIWPTQPLHDPSFCNLNVPQLAWLERSTKRHGPPKKFVVTGGTWKYSQCMSSFNEVMHYFAVIGAVSQRWIHP